MKSDRPAARSYPAKKRSLSKKAINEWEETGSNEKAAYPRNFKKR